MDMFYQVQCRLPNLVFPSFHIRFTLKKCHQDLILMYLVFKKSFHWLLQLLSLGVWKN